MASWVDLSKLHVRVWAYALAVHAALFSMFYGPPGTGALFIIMGGGAILALVRMYHDGESLLLFSVQVLYVSVVVGLIGTALSEAFDAQIKSGSPLRALDLAICAMAGAWFGWFIARKTPSLVATGKWIWILPFPLLTYSFLHDWFSQCAFCPDAKMVYFYSSAGLGRIITVPAFSFSGYSFGMLIVSRKRREGSTPMDAVERQPPALP